MSPVDVPDPLPLRSIPVPPEIARVDGCDCGGLEWHRAPGWQGDPGCSIWGMPDADQMAAITDAEDRVEAFTAALNTKLRQRMRR